MVKNDAEAAKSKKTLETPNPEKVPDGPNLPGSKDSRIEKDTKLGARVSAHGGDDMSVTLAELSSKKSGKKGAHQLKDGAKEASKRGDLGVTDEDMEDTSGGGDDSVVLRRSGRKKVVTDSGERSKKLKRIGKKGKEEEEEEEEEQRPEEEDDEDEEEEDESEFSVGDFVWGKVKSHPWWPGRVFNPSDASQQALKYKHEGRILVAYFGDATFAWCDESQLKPFVENFTEMSKQSSSKNFLNAVEEAVTEFARLVELDMTCYCTPRVELSGHDQGSALNAGIKGGVNVNKGGIGMYSVDRFNPAAFLNNLRVVGKHGSVNTLLELMTLKSWVSAVYRSKDGPLMLKFNEMQEEEECEGVGEGVEESIRGPVEEPVQVFPGMPDSAVSAKRKERSVAEILYGSEKANDDDSGQNANDDDGGVVEGPKSLKTDLKSVRKKRKALDEIQKKDEDESLINQSGKKEKKLKDISKGEAESGHGVNPEDVKKAGSRSSRMKVKETPKPVVVDTNLVALEESEMSPRTRERKKSKYLSPPYTIIEYNRQMAAARAMEASNLSQSVETSSKSASGEPSKKNLPKEDGAEQEKPNGSVPDTPRRASNRKVGGTKGVASSNNVLSGIQSAARNGQLSKEDGVKGFLSSYRSSKYQHESSCNPSETEDQSGGKGDVENEENKYLKKCKDKLKNKAKEVDSEKEVVNEGRKRSKKSEAKNEKSKLKNKGGVVDSEKNGLDGRKSLKKSEAKDEKAKLKNKGKAVDLENEDNVTGTPKSAALHLKFPADYTLPSKDDLVATFAKFGALATSRTKISEESSTAKLVFLRNSDAEAACKSSRESSPFGEAKVSFRVRLLKATYEEKEADENGFLKESTNLDFPKRKRSSKKQSSKASEPDGGLRIVKQKLDGMSTMVAEADDGKMSSELKLNLESRLKDLLDEVKSLP